MSERDRLITAPCQLALTATPSQSLAAVYERAYRARDVKYREQVRSLRRTVAELILSAPDHQIEVPLSTVEYVAGPDGVDRWAIRIAVNNGAQTRVYRIERHEGECP